MAAGRGGYQLWRMIRGAEAEDAMVVVVVCAMK
jgi:hypothetical protein